MKTFKKILFASLILLFTISCKKDDLPAATQEGKNIMAAKVNGKTWVKTACWSCIGAGGGLNVSYENGILSIRGEQFVSKTNDNVIGILIQNPKIGDNIVDGSRINLEYNDYGNKKYYKTYSNSIGVVNITKIDTIKKIISGTFHFDAVNENDLNDTVSITDGRFDVTYN
ncbi:DUF6252 family protein [Pedobacter alpinus]|uniref:DUF6252 family protein n=1 Tax=Pedobacter alpinus TaxID=1590643 RepID=A0ABW5TQ80_9SPHI